MKIYDDNLELASSKIIYFNKCKKTSIAQLEEIENQLMWMESGEIPYSQDRLNQITMRISLLLQEIARFEFELNYINRVISN